MEGYKDHGARNSPIDITQATSCSCGLVERFAVGAKKNLHLKQCQLIALLGMFREKNVVPQKSDRNTGK